MANEAEKIARYISVFNKLSQKGKEKALAELDFIASQDHESPLQTSKQLLDSLGSEKKASHLFV